jgi:peptidoglycan/LPS O-acetylase OafA/YrhL
MTQPPTVRYAGYLVTLEGLLGVIAAIVLVVRAVAGADQHVVSGYGTAAWFAIVGGAVLAGGWALVTGRRWGRGLAVFANLLLLGVAWYIYGSHQLVYAALVTALALATLGLLFSPSAVRWASNPADSD